MDSSDSNKNMGWPNFVSPRYKTINTILLYSNFTQVACTGNGKGHGRTIAQGRERDKSGFINLLIIISIECYSAARGPAEHGAHLAAPSPC